MSDFYPYYRCPPLGSDIDSFYNAIRVGNYAKARRMYYNTDLDISHVAPEKEGFGFAIYAASSLSIETVRLCEKLGYVLLDNQYQLTEMIIQVLSKKPSSHRKEMLDYIIYKIIGKDIFLEKYSTGVFLNKWLIKWGKDALRPLVEDYDVSINTHNFQTRENILMMYLSRIKEMYWYEKVNDRITKSLKYILEKGVDLDWVDEEGNNYIKYLLIKWRSVSIRKEIWILFRPYMKKEHFDQKNKLGEYPICHAFTLYPSLEKDKWSFLNFLMNLNDSLDLRIDFSVTDSKGRNIFYSQYKRYELITSEVDIKYIFKVVDRLLEKGADPYHTYPKSCAQDETTSVFDSLPVYIQKHIEDTWSAYQVKEPS